MEKDASSRRTFARTRSRDADAVARSEARRAVMNDVRREVERHARIAVAAEELSKAAADVLARAETSGADVEGALAALRAALMKYHQAADR